MANNYFTKSTFVPFEIARSDDVNQTEENTEAAFDILPDPITSGTAKGFTETFRVNEAPDHEYGVVRVFDVASGSLIYGEATTSDNLHYNVTIDNYITSLSAGIAILVKWPSTNDGQTYLNLNSTGDVEIVSFDGDSLHGGELVAGGLVELAYTGSKFQIISQSSTVAEEAPEDGNYYGRRNAAWENLDNRYVPASGGDFTGQIDFSTVVSLTGGNTENRLRFMNSATTGDGARFYLENYNNAFYLTSYNESGGGGTNVAIYHPTYVDFIASPRHSSDPSTDDDLARKAYVDTQDNALQADIDTKMPIAGGTFTGAPKYASDPGDDDTLARKAYVDTQDSNLQSQINNKADTTYVDSQDSALQSDIDTKMPIAGGTFTGAPKYASDPGDADTLTRKSYVDAQDSSLQSDIDTKMPISGGNFTGAITVLSQTVWNNGNVDSQASTNGYLEFPNGIIVQWGRAQNGSGSSDTGSSNTAKCEFAQAFPNNVFAFVAFADKRDTTSTDFFVKTHAANPPTTSVWYVTCVNHDGTAHNDTDDYVCWIAVGN